MLRTSLLLPVVALMLFSCTPRYYQGPVSDHFDGTRFLNPGKPMDKGFFEVLKWYVTRQPQPWPEFAELPVTDKPPQRVLGDQLRVSFVDRKSVV